MLPYIVCAQDTATIYNTPSGVRGVYTTEIIIKTENTLSIYKTDNGVREVTPYSIIDETNRQYNVVGGVREALPNKEIVIENE